MKCDEAKPSCLRCLKSGRKCDGYSPALSRSRALIRQISPTVEFESPAGLRAFDYYHSRLVPVLGGIYTSELWGDAVIQLSLTEPVVHHSLISLSSFLECELVKDGRDRTKDRNFAFREYAKAISAMRNWTPKDGPMTIPLLVCILFTCVEFMLDRSVASQLHICQGRKLLSSLENDDSSISDLVKRDLVPIYSRLSLAAFFFGSRPEPIPKSLGSSPAPQAEFSSLKDAKNCLYHLLDDCLRFTTQGKPAVYAANLDYTELAALQQIQQMQLSRLAGWNSAFTMLTTNLAQTTLLRMAQNLMQMYYHAAVVWISTALQPLELAYDSHIPAFASIISLASSVLNQTNASKRLPEFSFETELIAPLYWTATKCRHPSLRRAALRLLLKDELRNRKENLWHAKDAIVIAARVIELEEEGLDVMVEDPSSQGESSGQELTPSTTSASDASSPWWTYPDLDIPLSKPPTLPPPSATLDISTIAPDLSDGEDVDFSFDQPIRQTDSEVAENPLLKSAAQMAAKLPRHGNNLSPPFYIPETKRIKNTLIEPRQTGGVWITMFRDLDDGQEKWDITKEFLAI